MENETRTITLCIFSTMKRKEPERKEAKKKSGDVSTDKEFSGSFAVSIVNYDVPSLSIASLLLDDDGSSPPFFRVVSLSRSVRRAYKLWWLMLRLRNCMDLRHVSRGTLVVNLLGNISLVRRRDYAQRDRCACPQKLRSSVIVALPTFGETVLRSERPVY